MTPELAATCAEVIEQAFEFILDLDNGVADMAMVPIADSMTIDFFAAIDDAVPALHMESVDLGGLRLTRDGNIVEFWFEGEKENSAGLHAFVKEYAFSRVWAAFKPGQRELGLQPVAEGALKTKAGKPAKDPG
jgi:hypothetical protein